MRATRDVDVRAHTGATVMLRHIASLVLLLVVAACGSKGPRELEPPRSFPIFEGGKFGFVNASGDVTIKPEHEYWGPIPVGGSAAPAAGPEGTDIAGRLTDGSSISRSLGTSTNKPSEFWLLPGAEGALSLTISSNSGEFAPSMVLYEYRNGSWDRVSSSDYGTLVHTNLGAARYPMGVLVSTRTYFTYSSPTRWKGGPYTASIELSGQRPTELDFLNQLRFLEGRLPYRVGERWGFLAEDGTIAINPQFDSVNTFSDGLAAFRTKDRWGFVDREGTVVIQPTYDRVGYFIDGLVAAWVGEKCGFIDREGRFAVNPTYTGCTAFHDGMAVVSDGDRWGAVDPEGKVLIAPQFDLILHLSGDHASVKLGNKWGIVDRTGRITLVPTYDWVSPPWEGELWQVRQGKRSGFIDLEGKFIIGPTLDDARVFFEGVVVVRSGDRWGFLKPDGTYLGGAGPTYDEARRMRNGRAAVRIGDRWGFIDDKGGMVVSPAYDAVGDFDGDLAAVFKDGMLGYIDRSGKQVRPLMGGGGPVAVAGTIRRDGAPL